MCTAIKLSSQGQRSRSNKPILFDLENSLRYITMLSNAELRHLHIGSEDISVMTYVDTQRI